MAQLAGLFVLFRHGDRQGFYQDPLSYAVKSTNLTLLGYLQEYQNGQDVRALYLSGPNATVPLGLSTDVIESSQLSILADAGGEGSVIVDSADAMLQGLYPPTNQNLTLANGTTVNWDGRTQPVQISTIEAEQSVSLEGFTQCSAFQSHLSSLYKSPGFVDKQKEAQPFFDTLKGLLGPSRPSTLVNAWNVFDFLNVESIHNATLAPQISPETLAQARALANYHEAASFTTSDFGSVANIAGTPLLPTLLNDLGRIANASDPLKLSLVAISYKPFLSLFRMLDLPSPLSDSVVDYASTAIFEVYTDSSVRLLFRNGTQGAFLPQSMLNATTSSIGSTKLPELRTVLEPYSISTLAQWCDLCQETEARGCDVLARYNGTGGLGDASPASTTGKQAVSPLAAGFIGAVVALVAAAAALAVWNLFCAAGRRGGRRRSEQVRWRSSAIKQGSAGGAGPISPPAEHELEHRESGQSRASWKGEARGP